MNTNSSNLSNLNNVITLNTIRVHSEHLYYAGNALALISRPDSHFAYDLLGKRNWMPMGSVNRIVVERANLKAKLVSLAQEHLGKLAKDDKLYLVAVEVMSYERAEKLYLLLKASSEENAMLWSQHSPHWRLLSVQTLLEYTELEYTEEKTTSWYKLTDKLFKKSPKHRPSI